MKKVLQVGVMLKGVRITMGYNYKFNCWWVERTEYGSYRMFGGLKSKEEAQEIYRKLKEELR